MKSHHYIPQTYLKRFVNPKRGQELWQFSLEDGSAVASTPKKCGCADYYHSIQTCEGRDDESIERSFHRNENNLPALFESIRNRRVPSEDDWWTLFWMVALHMVRVPKFQDSFGQSMSAVYQQMFEIMRQTPDFRAVGVQNSIPEEAVVGARVKATSGAVLCLTLSRFTELTKHLNRMSWVFLCSPPGEHFFTTDAPVRLWTPREERTFGGVGLLTPGCELTFPVTRRVCALASHEARPDHLFIDVDPKQVKTLNFRVISGGYRYVYGPSDDAVIRGWAGMIAEARSKPKPNP